VAVVLRVDGPRVLDGPGAPDSAAAPDDARTVVAELDSSIIADSDSGGVAATSSSVTPELLQQGSQFSEPAGPELQVSSAPATLAESSTRGSADLAADSVDTADEATLASVAQSVNSQSIADRSRAAELSSRVDKLGRKKLSTQAESAVEARDVVKASEVSAPVSSLADVELPASPAFSTSESKVSNTTGVIVVDIEWVKSKSPGLYTIQMAVANDVSYLRDFAVSSGLAGSFVIVPFNTADGPSFSLLFGEYETFEAAQAGLQRLKGQATQFSPWIRNFGILQQR